MSVFDALKQLRMVTVVIGVVVIVVAVFVAHIIYSAGQRDLDAANMIATRMEQDALVRTQLNHMNNTLRERARLLVPYCKADVSNALFRHALLIAPGLNANLTGTNGVAPQNTSQAATPSPPPPQQNLVTQAVQTVTGTKAQASPTPAPQLQMRSMGENVTGPFLLVIRALTELQKDPAVLSATISNITQATGDAKSGANAATFTITMTQASIDPSTCSQIDADAAFKVAPSISSAHVNPKSVPTIPGSHRVHFYRHHFAPSNATAPTQTLVMPTLGRPLDVRKVEGRPASGSPKGVHK